MHVFIYARFYLWTFLFIVLYTYVNDTGLKNTRSYLLLLAHGRYD